MAEFIEAAAAVLTASQRRVEVAAQNVANMMTPGYRRRVAFEQILNSDAGANRLPTLSIGNDFTPGKPVGTANALDLAILGPGFFAVQSGAETFYTRNGQFKRGDNGQLMTEAGLSVQADGGGDIVVKSDHFQVKEDGSIVEEGAPVGKLAIMDFSDRTQAVPTEGGLFTTPQSNATSVEHPRLRQSALESSNMSTGEEMVTIMASLRSAEAAQRLMNVYDDLMGRVITSFGQA